MQKKKMFGFDTRKIVATALGAALFTLLFMYVKIPTGIPETQIQTAYGIGAFFAAMYGPICGGLVAFIGHFLSDTVQYGSAWMSWVIASGVTCFIIGLVYPRLHVDEGQFGVKDAVMFNVFQIVGNAISWIIIAPVLDIVIYAEAPSLVFVQGVVAFITNALSAGIIGTILLKLYSSTRASKGSLKKEE